jgi:hypothetical protein
VREIDALRTDLPEISTDEVARWMRAGLPIKDLTWEPQVAGNLRAIVRGSSH